MAPGSIGFSSTCRPQTRELGRGCRRRRPSRNGAKQGKNDFGNIGYGGPAPPKGKPHRYFFKLYALDAAVDLLPGRPRLN